MRPTIDFASLLAAAALAMILASMAGCGSANRPKWAATPVEAQAVEIERVAPVVRGVAERVPPMLAGLEERMAGAGLDPSPEAPAIAAEIAKLPPVADALDAMPEALRAADVANARLATDAQDRIARLERDLAEAKEGQTAWLWMIALAVSGAGVPVILFLGQPKLGGALIATGIGLIVLAEFLAWAAPYLFVAGIVGVVGVVGWTGFEVYKRRSEIDRFADIARGAAKLAKEGQYTEAFAALRADPQVDEAFIATRRAPPVQNVPIGTVDWPGSLDA